MAFSDLHTLNLDWVIKQIKHLLQTNLTKDSIVQEIKPGQGADLIPSAPAVMRYVDEHGGGGGGGAVSSVNGKTGAVVLSAADVGAVSSVNNKTGAVKLTAADLGAMSKHLLTYDGSRILSGSTALTFAKLHSLLLQEPAFVVLIYNDYAYHPNLVSNYQIVFASAYPVNGYDKSRRITLLSNGTVTVSETESEKTSSRVAAIGAGDVGSTTKYPSIKAVVDYVSAQIGVIEYNLSTLADYAEEVSA